MAVSSSSSVKMMSRKRIQCAIVVTLILCLPTWVTPVARADHIVVQGMDYVDAVVTGLHAGRIEFRTVEGEMEAAWISDVDLVIVDRGGAMTDFNQAERLLAGGEPGKAIERYRRSLRLSEGFWRDLVTARLLMVCTRAGQIDGAARAFILVTGAETTGPALAARLIPDTFPTRRDKATSAAIEELDTAIAKAPDDERRAVLQLLRYAILQHISDRRTAGAMEQVATLVIPASARSRRAYAIQLTALQQVLKDRPTKAVWDGLDRAIRWAPEEIVPAFLLLKGRTLLERAETREEIIRASWPFMHVAIHMPDDPRAADGLYGAAVALERIGIADKALVLLDECMAHKRISDKTRKMAQAARERLKQAADPRVGAIRAEGGRAEALNR